MLAPHVAKETTKNVAKKTTTNVAKTTTNVEKNNNNQIMTINESFLLSHCCRIRYLCFQWKENKNKKKKQKRKAIYYSTKYYDYEVCLSFWFSTT